MTKKEFLKHYKHKRKPRRIALAQWARKRERTFAEAAGWVETIWVKCKFRPHILYSRVKTYYVSMTKKELLKHYKHNRKPRWIALAQWARKGKRTSGGGQRQYGKRSYKSESDP